MKKILIVDDDKKGVAPLAIRLTNAGYEVLTAFDGIDGLKLAVHHRPDLIVMDIWMPGGVGILTAQRINRFVPADVPVMLLTGRRTRALPNAHYPCDRQQRPGAAEKSA